MVHTLTYCRGCNQMVGIPWGKPPICDSCREQQKAAEVSRDTTANSEPAPPKDAA